MSRFRGSFSEWETEQIEDSEFYFGTAKLFGRSERGEAPPQGWFWVINQRDFSGVEMTDGSLYSSREKAESAGRLVLAKLRVAFLKAVQ